jgi:hypothetical protein
MPGSPARGGSPPGAAGYNRPVEQKRPLAQEAEARRVEPKHSAPPYVQRSSAGVFAGAFCLSA